MIFPLLRGIVSMAEAPITWLLVIFNVFVFLFFAQDKRTSENYIDSLAEDSAFINTQGQLYQQFLKEEGASRSHFVEEMSQAMEKGGESQIRYMAVLSMRDPEFLALSETREWKGDQVAIARWKKKIKQINRVRAAQVSVQWGVSSYSPTWRHWVTYQFFHAEFIHLFVNLIYLIIFGMAVEVAFGSLTMISLYFASGLAAAANFIWLTGVTNVPLIGASGSISGLMAFFALLFFNRPVQFLYFLFPMPRYMGVMYLPAWTLFIIWFLTDLARYLGTLSELGGIAYTAHLGGGVFGIALALCYMVFNRKREWVY